MSFYKELNPILNITTNMLLENENIVKLLNYYPSEIDFAYNPLIQPVLSNPYILLMDKLFPMPKLPDAQTQQKCFIGIGLKGDKEIGENSGYRRVLLIFDIICHLDSWIIKDGFRPISIMSEIDSMFNNQTLLELPIVNKPFAQPFIPRIYSDKYSGYQLTYVLQISSNVKC